jgi:hypothetical protein
MSLLRALKFVDIPLVNSATNLRKVTFAHHLYSQECHTKVATIPSTMMYDAYGYSRAIEQYFQAQNTAIFTQLC